MSDTITAAPTGTVALIDGDTINAGESHDTPTADTLRAAIVAVDTVGAASSAASASLKAVALARFAHHAAPFALARGGRDVLPVNLKREAAGLVWRDITGDTKPVPVADRTPGQKLLGEYLSRFARVATNMEVGGIEPLSSVESFEDSLAEVVAADKEANKHRDGIIAERNEREYTVWFNALPEGDRAAINRVIAVFANGNPGAVYAEPFAAAIVKSASGK